MPPSANGDREALTQKEAASRLGISAKQLRRLTKRHDAPRNDDKSYPWPRLRDWYIEFKQDEVKRRRGIDVDAASWDEARAREKAAKAAMAELDLLERKGELIPLRVHVDRIREVAESIRDRLMNLPGRQARELAAAEDPQEVTRLLERAVREVLEELQRLEADDDG